MNCTISYLKRYIKKVVSLNLKQNTKGTIVAALFVSDDESSPLKFITNQFTAFDIDDYLNAEDIEHLLNRLN